ncbi:tRNA epoxyqueuosine(34) reductase QueG [Alicyclobacillus sendaiensis]|uniref:tRNA epoxyqueuosine(34) reductase QueG n=1 Tax=Alicyclobacillus sendaiensis PA2 TaxID=3029425 RepID=A0ABT6XXF0_ALISE|nr:tRNA epoxyqueuosine(34) reductase QueG [Alicyclobacillus sendaiensis]MDI9259768.1 tRNA epoxyqueuosine(34) reductase QueG [Alicyclobacillus sendaiensis PA2]
MRRIGSERDPAVTSRDKIALAEIRPLAEEVGLPEIAATDASPFDDLATPLAAYAARGRTGFEWDNASERMDPRFWLPEAKSIVTAALPYLTEEGARQMRHHPRSDLRGQTSCYVYGEDYHRVLSERLTELAKRLEKLVGREIRHRVAVDTSPLVDRRVAERSGLGWIGKNGMLFSPRYGSYVFLGALLLDIEIEDAKHLPPDVGKFCGDCDLCMRACPTQAFVAPGELKATACLSYVTQMKGTIPRPYRKPLGRRVWGCDVCQQVCPHNRHRAPARDPSFSPDAEAAYPDLVRLLKMSNRQFLRAYGRSAMAWRGVRTLQRNALVALGNLRRPEAVPVVARFLASDRPELRASAAWALGEIGGEDALRELQAALGSEQDPDVRQEMEEAIANVSASICRRGVRRDEEGSGHRRGEHADWGDVAGG